MFEGMSVGLEGISVVPEGTSVGDGKSVDKVELDAA